eukprot:519369_1
MALMADVTDFLNESDSEETEVSDIEIEDQSNQIDDDNDIEITNNVQSISNTDSYNAMMMDTSNPDEIIRVEDLFAEQSLKDKEANKALPSVSVAHQKSLSFDLGHLSCYDPIAIDMDQLFKHRKDSASKVNNEPHILNQTEYQIRKLKEKYLYDMTRTNVQAMVNKLHSFQAIKTGPNDDPGIVVRLPPVKTKLPRSKPIPEAQPLTRWEKFAARKGIRSSKKTKDLLQWDENVGEWRKKYGYKRANNPLDNPIFEHKDNDFDVKDPWTKMEKAKKKRIAINKENQMRNLQEATGDRIGGTLDLESAMNWNKNKNKKQIGSRAIKEQENKKKSKSRYGMGHLNVALSVAQHSTGSMGKFDELNRNEGKPTLKKNRKKTVDYMQTNDNTKVHQFRHGKQSFSNKERNKQKEILFNIFGAQQKDAFNMVKATKHEQFVIEKKRAKKNRSRKKKKYRNSKRLNTIHPKKSRLPGSGCKGGG